MPETRTLIASTEPPARRRGRPAKGSTAPEETRAAIIRAGMALMTEQGLTATGIDQVLKAVGVPKGSFYHYFGSKDAFVKEVIAAYGRYFAVRLARHFENPALPPLERLLSYVEDAKAGMAKHDFRRGCLMGNLGQEVSALTDELRADVEAVFQDWEQRLAACLGEAAEAGTIAREANMLELARGFWTGWEGAVLRARLRHDSAILDLYARQFIAGLPRHAASNLA